jgi:hypothetical protein
MSAFGRLVAWQFAQLTWTPDGNQLDLPLVHQLDDRHADAVGDQISRALDGPLSEPWVVCDGTRITIRSWELHQLSPRQLRDAVESALAAALAKVQAQLHWESTDVGRWLAELRRAD